VLINQVKLRRASKRLGQMNMLHIHKLIYNNFWKGRLCCWLYKKKGTALHKLTHFIPNQIMIINFILLLFCENYVDDCIMKRFEMATIGNGEFHHMHPTSYI